MSNAKPRAAMTQISHSVPVRGRGVSDAVVSIFLVPSSDGGDGGSYTGWTLSGRVSCDNRAHRDRRPSFLKPFLRAAHSRIDWKLAMPGRKKTSAVEWKTLLDEMRG